MSSGRRNSRPFGVVCSACRAATTERVSELAGYGKGNELGLITGNATAAAAVIFAGLYTEWDLEAFEAIRTDILNGSLALQGATSTIESIETPSAPRRSYGGGGGNSGGSAGSTELRSGKYAGKTVDEVIELDLEYAEWFAESGKNEFMAKKFAEALAA